MAKTSWISLFFLVTFFTIGIGFKFPFQRRVLTPLKYPIDKRAALPQRDSDRNDRDRNDRDRNDRGRNDRDRNDRDRNDRDRNDRDRNDRDRNDRDRNDRDRNDRDRNDRDRNDRDRNDRDRDRRRTTPKPSTTKATTTSRTTKTSRTTTTTSTTIYSSTSTSTTKATTSTTTTKATTTSTTTTPAPYVTSLPPNEDGDIDDNSDEVDPDEEKQVYSIKRNEKFIPPACGKKVNTCDANAKFRTLDGSCNNLLHTEWGLTNSTYGRLLLPEYGNRRRSPRRSFDRKRPLPNARKIRVEVFPVGQKENTLWNINAMQWGQFMAHDMSLLKEPDVEFECCTEDGKYKKRRSRFCYPIKVPAKDATMGKAGIRCLNFTRTVTDKDLGCGKGNSPAQQINVVTPWLDLSNVYGMDKQTTDSLRTLKNGLLATEVRNGVIFPPKETNLMDNCRCNRNNENVCYKTGDSRSNQNPQLAILQTIFVREHNRIAKELAKINPQWNDERLFQETRRILIATYQKMTYYDWLTIFLGSQNMIDKKLIYRNQGFIDDYDSSLNPEITNEHAHAAFRFFHTHIVGDIRLLDAQRETDSTFSLSTWFNRPQIIEKGNNIQQLTIGMVTQNLEETDDKFPIQILDELFACGKKFGIDLRAADIQRDRDHALAYYNDYRKYCGLKEANSFDDYKDLIPSDKVEILKKLYKSYKDVDLTVGGGLENLANGAQVGPTFLCILNEQFLRSRQADRFWFENKSSGFTEDQIKEIRKATVSRMFCDNGDGITSMQRLGFTLILSFNPLVPCNQIPSMNLTVWKE